MEKRCANVDFLGLFRRQGADEEWLGFVNAALTKMKETGKQKKLSE